VGPAADWLAASVTGVAVNTVFVALVKPSDEVRDLRKER
jgi:hypothetical protein